MGVVWCGVVWFGVYVWQVPDEWMYRQVDRAWVLGGWRSSWGLVWIAGTSQTDLGKVTGAGMRASSTVACGWMFGQCVDVMVCGGVRCVCATSARRVDVGTRPHQQQVARAWVLARWVMLLVGARIDCWHTHTGLNKVTDAGMKDFSAALASSTTITTVILVGTSVWCVRMSGPVCYCVCKRLVTL